MPLIVFQTVCTCYYDSYLEIKKLLHGETVEEKEAEAWCKVISCAQDIVYGVSDGTKWTPKHVGLGSTLHQVTRSKDLVHLFNKAGHILSYDQILQVDTSLAESVLKSLDPETGSVMPPNLLNLFTSLQTILTF